MRQCRGQLDGHHERTGGFGVGPRQDADTEACGDERADAVGVVDLVRMGTAEIYWAVLAFDEILDALVVDVPDEDTHWMPLFIVLRDDATLDDALRRRITTQIRQDCSPRHIPDDIYTVPEIPRTLSGKLLEVPVKRLLAGEAAELVLQRDGLRNADAIDPLLAIADARHARALR